MPVEAGATVGEDTIQPVLSNEKNAPVVNGNNVETLPKGIGKQVINLLLSVTGIFFSFFFFNLSRWWSIRFEVVNVLIWVGDKYNL